MPDALAFVDLETTGLDPDRHEAWEVGLIVRNDSAEDVEYRWFLEVDLAKAELAALKIGKYHDRHPYGYFYTEKSPREHVERSAVVARKVAELTWGACLVGANVRFDEAFLQRLLLKRHMDGHQPGWHHRLCDIESAIGGKYAIEPPSQWGLQRLAEHMPGIDLSLYEEHSALGDARLARDMYDLVFITGRDYRPKSQPEQKQVTSGGEPASPVITTPGGSPEPIPQGLGHQVC